MNMQSSPSTVNRELVPEDQRLVVVERTLRNGLSTAIGTGHLRYHRTDGRGLRRRLLGVLDDVQRRLLHDALRGSHLPREVPEHVRRRPLGDAWGSRPVCTPTATCLSPTATSPGNMRVTITGCGRSWPSTRRSGPSWGRPTEVTTLPTPDAPPRAC